MRRFFYCVCVLFSLSAYFSIASAQKKSELKAIDKTTLMDKIKGGWAGKTIGCTYGGPVEFAYNGTMIQDYYPLTFPKDRIKWYYDHQPGLYDDLYVNIVLDEAVNKYGVDAPVDSIALSFSRTSLPLWHANECALYNIRHGIMPPKSGYWLYNPHADDIDFQIEADFIGLLTPGMPNVGTKLSDKIGHIFNYGDGWYGGVYVAAMYSMAFLSDDMEYVVSEALKTIPEKSNFYQCINDVIKWHKQFPNDWKQTWCECQKKWHDGEGCPDGAFSSFDINAKINSAYVVIGLLYGGKDFYKTIDIATRCGQDADCNPSTAAGILGTMLGYSNIPEKWKEGLYPVEDRPFSFTDISLNKMYELNFNQTLQMIKKNGGKISKTQVFIKPENPIAVRYEKSYEGTYPKSFSKNNIKVKDTYEKLFEGTGFVQKGNIACKDKTYSAKLEFTVDGKSEGIIDLPTRTNNARDGRRDEICFKFQLPKGQHKFALKWINPRPDAEVLLSNFYTYSDTPNKLNYNE